MKIKNTPLITQKKIDKENNSPSNSKENNLVANG
jgi:hypothetical protein